MTALATLLLASELSLPILAMAGATDPDTAGMELMRRARDHQESTRREILAYDVLGRERLSFGLRSLGRERIVFRRELAARIHWSRIGGGRVEVLGAREVAPLFRERVSVPSNPGSAAAGMAFDPADDTFFTSLAGVSAERPDGQRDSWVKHPLTEGSEEHYRFLVGDTTTIRLADRSTVRLIELRVIPRRNDSRLVRGSYWLDAATYGPVRAVFRLERPFDLQLDSRNLDAESREGVDDVPLLMRPLVFPVRANLRMVTLEYSLWEGRWWLPRLIALDAVAEVGALGGLPFRFERSYSGFRVTGTPAEGQTAVPETASPVAECPEPRRRRGTPPGDPAEPATEDGDETERELSESQICHCTGGRCTVWEVELADTTALLAGPDLPGSIFRENGGIFGDAEMRELEDRLRSLGGAPWSFARPSLRWRVADGDLIRYNRVEGLSIGGRAELELGVASADLTARLGTADLRPGVEIGATREGPQRATRLAVYERLAAVDLAQRPFGLGNSLSALVLGRDDGDYFRGRGVEVIGGPGIGAAPTFQWRAYAERQRNATTETAFSLPHLVNRDRRFRPDHPADEADQVGLELSLTYTRGLDPTGFRWNSRVEVEGSTGTFSFTRSALTLGASFPISGGVVGAVETAGGLSTGELPAQSLWLLGGVPTIRGFAPAAAAGDAFWRARFELATTLPAARLVLFSDVGRAGERREIRLDPALVSAGAGVSLLDGLLRFDLARPLRGGEGWRLDAYVNAAL